MVSRGIPLAGLAKVRREDFKGDDTLTSFSGPDVAELPRPPSLRQPDSSGSCQDPQEARARQEVLAEPERMKELAQAIGREKWLPMTWQARLKCLQEYKALKDSQSKHDGSLPKSPVSPAGAESRASYDANTALPQDQTSSRQGEHTSLANTIPHLMSTRGSQMTVPEKDPNTTMVSHHSLVLSGKADSASPPPKPTPEPAKSPSKAKRKSIRRKSTSPKRRTLAEKSKSPVMGYQTSQSTDLAHIREELERECKPTPPISVATTPAEIPRVIVPKGVLKKFDDPSRDIKYIRMIDTHCSVEKKRRKRVVILEPTQMTVAETTGRQVRQMALEKLQQIDWQDYSQEKRLVMRFEGEADAAFIQTNDEGNPAGANSMDDGLLNVTVRLVDSCRREKGLSHRTLLVNMVPTSRDILRDARTAPPAPDSPPPSPSAQPKRRRSLRRTPSLRRTSSARNKQGKALGDTELAALDEWEKALAQDNAKSRRATLPPSEAGGSVPVQSGGGSVPVQSGGGSIPVKKLSDVNEAKVKVWGLLHRARTEPKVRELLLRAASAAADAYGPGEKPSPECLMEDLLKRAEANPALQDLLFKATECADLVHHRSQSPIKSYAVLDTGSIPRATAITSPPSATSAEQQLSHFLKTPAISSPRDLPAPAADRGSTTADHQRDIQKVREELLMRLNQQSPIAAQPAESLQEQLNLHYSKMTPREQAAIDSAAQQLMEKRRGYEQGGAVGASPSTGRATVIDHSVVHSPAPLGTITPKTSPTAPQGIPSPPPPAAGLASPPAAVGPSRIEREMDAVMARLRSEGDRALERIGTYAAAVPPHRPVPGGYYPTVSPGTENAFLSRQGLQSPRNLPAQTSARHARDLSPPPRGLSTPPIPLSMG